MYDDSQRLLSGRGSRPNLVQRFALFLLLATLAVIGFFFLTVLLVAGTVAAAVVAVRFWWLMRGVRAQRAANAALEGEYRVVERSGAGEHLGR
jgi:hypothetical protein